MDLESPAAIANFKSLGGKTDRIEIAALGPTPFTVIKSSKHCFSSFVKKPNN